MPQKQIEDRTPFRRHWVEQAAIALAMQSRWHEAETMNRSILALFPTDVDALNRLGRALNELGRCDEAKSAYAKALSADPWNVIASRNLERLSALQSQQLPAKPRAKHRVDPSIFIAEAGKTGVTTLLRPANKQVLAKVSVGDQVHPTIEGRALFILSGAGEHLGQVEPRLSQRLIDLIRGGNRYATAVVSLDDAQVRVIITEIHQDPSQKGKVAFPSKGPEDMAVKPYIRDSLIKYELGDADEDDPHEEPDYGMGIEGQEPRPESELAEEDEEEEEEEEDTDRD